MEFLDLPPDAGRRRQRPPARLEEHLQPRAAAGRARRGRDRHPRPAAVGRRRTHARGPARARRRLAARGRQPGLPCMRRRRPLPGQDRRSLPRQRRHRLPAAHRGARAVGRRVPPVGRTAHARAPDRRPRRRAAPARRRHHLHRQRGLPSAASQARHDPSRWRGARAWRRLQPVPHRAADGAAADRSGDHDRGGGRAHLQAPTSASPSS